MSEQFHGREQEVRLNQRRYQERPSHSTLETVHVERSTDGVSSPLSTGSNAQGGIFARIGRFIRSIFGAR